MAALVSWKDRAQRALKRAKDLRAELDSDITHAKNDGLTIGGGAVAGLVDGAITASGKQFAIPIPGVPGGSIPGELALGALVLGLAFADAGGAARELHAFGSGVAAYGAGKAAANFVAAKVAKGNVSNG